MIDRVEYVLRLTHDHCDDGDGLRHRQRRENAEHAQKTQELLTIARGIVALLERELQPYAGYLPPQQQPQQQPVERIGQRLAAKAAAE